MQFRWETGSNKSADMAVKVERDKFIAYFQETKRNFEHVLSLDWYPGQILLLNYEEMVDNIQETTYSKICPFLRLSPFEARSPMQKQAVTPLEQSIENSYELEDILYGDEYKLSLQPPSSNADDGHHAGAGLPKVGDTTD